MERRPGRGHRPTPGRTHPYITNYDPLRQPRRGRRQNGSWRTPKPPRAREKPEPGGFGPRRFAPRAETDARPGVSKLEGELLLQVERGSNDFLTAFPLCMPVRAVDAASFNAGIHARFSQRVVATVLTQGFQNFHGTETQSRNKRIHSKFTRPAG